MSRKKCNKNENDLPWINPIGGFGDMLMLSGVLEQVHDRDESRTFNMVLRTKYRHIFEEHPAIARLGHPPENADMKRMDYWSIEDIGPGDKRPYQILAREYGLKTPVEEKLFLPNETVEDPLLHAFIPWKEKNVLIAPSSESPRKCAPPHLWHQTVDMLLAAGAFVMQAGRLNELHIRNTYSLLGLTNVRQAIALVKRCSLVITSDNFFMHATHLTGTPAIVLWGPTNHEVYGYPGQRHLQMAKTCDLGPYDDCIGPRRNEAGKTYGTPCPHGGDHCMNKVRPAEIFDAARKLLAARLDPQSRRAPY